MKLVSVIVLFLFFGAVAPAPASVNPDHLIVPGESVGPVHIGMTIEDAEKAWGHPKDVLSGIIFYFTIPGSDGRIAVTAGMNYIIGITVQYDGSYQTAEGIHAVTAQPDKSITLGSTAKDVREGLGDPGRVDKREAGHEIWRYPGLTIDLRQQKNVYYVTELTILKK